MYGEADLRTVKEKHLATQLPHAAQGTLGESGAGGELKPISTKPEPDLRSALTSLTLSMLTTWEKRHAHFYTSVLFVSSPSVLHMMLSKEGEAIRPGKSKEK